MTKDVKPAEPKGPPKLADLLEPFPDVGHLFKAYDSEEGKRAKKGVCRECNQYHAICPGAHIPYVGHAAVTKRLLLVDPTWDWAPLAVDEHGLPRFVRTQDGRAVGLWINLTVLSVTRRGYGSVLPGAFEAEKQLIGDAIRNAAMRFGVALDCWSKEELETAVGELESEEEEDSGTLEAARSHAEKANKAPTKKQKDEEAKKAEDRSDLMREADEAFGGPIEVRSICGLPVHRTWASLKGEKIGRNAAEYGPGIPSSKLAFAKSWEWASEGLPGGERATWLEAMIQRAREKHAAAPSEPLHVSLQAALLAYDVMQSKLAPPPEGDEATYPTQESEV